MHNHTVLAWLLGHPQYCVLQGRGCLSSLAPKQDAIVHRADIFLVLPYSLTPKHFKNTVYGCVQSRMAEMQPNINCIFTSSIMTFLELVF